MKLDLKSIAIIVLIIGMIIGGTIMTNRNKRLANEVRTEVNLKNALQDSIRTYQNKEGEWVTEKLTLQADVSTLEDDNLNLTENQKKLVSKVKNLQKDKDVITAALIEQSATIDSLEQFATNVDTVGNIISFIMNTDTLKYDIKVKNVKPIEKLRPMLAINKLVIPNKQFIEFHWEDSKTTPIAFSVTNSNPLFITNNIDSYAIPELIKEEINPTGWQKIKKWFKENGQKVGIFAGGAVIGGLVVMGMQ
jgi:uncharacterized membrane-anchored protein YhcB (DUF1043 family)